MRRILIAALCLATLPAAAGDLSGRWNVASPSRPGYEGVVLIDGQRRATWTAPEDAGRPAEYFGYVRFSDTSRVEMMMTNRAIVVRIDCSITSSDLLHCRTSFPDGKTSPMYTLSRVGDAPLRLTASH